MNGIETDVLIVGGGPVGLSLAVELGWRGIPSVLLERRGTNPGLPRMNGVNARSMEFCRRWGIADEVRAAGWPRDYPRRMLYATSLAGYELACVDFGLMAPGATANSPEHFQRCSQMWFDPLLRQAAERLPSVDLRYRTELAKLDDFGDRVVGHCLDKDTGSELLVEAQYAVACDGGRSGIRSALDIQMDGNPALSREVSFYFESDAPLTGHDKGLSAMTWLIGPEGMWAALSAIDGRRLWRLWVTQLSPNEDATTADAAGYIGRALGISADFRVFGIAPWDRQQLVAQTYGRGRVFLAGDAVHTLTPTGGFGMNTGIQDAVDLGWKLAAVLQGWAPNALLDTYEKERRPVGIRNVNEATFTFAKFLELPKLPAICDDSPEGLGARKLMSDYIADNEFDREYVNEGIVLGYRYDGSSICVHDGSLTPPDEVRSYTPTARPGARAPHIWLDDGRSIIDHYGKGFTLLRLGRDAADTSSLEAAAAFRHVPLTLVTIEQPAVVDLYERQLVLVRPDGHVAWRGDTLPPEPLGLVDKVRGA